MIIFMYVLTTFVCPQYIIIGLLVSAILENEADELFRPEEITIYNSLISVIMQATLWPVILFYYAKKRIKEIENA